MVRKKQRELRVVSERVSTTLFIIQAFIYFALGFMIGMVIARW